MGKCLLRRWGRPLGRRRGEAGFTLVEVIVAETLTLIFMIGIASMFNYAMRTFGDSERLTVATNLAYQKLADFKTLPLATIVANGNGTDTTTQENIQYTRAWVVENVPGTFAGSPVGLVGDLVKVTCTVSWAARGRSHSVSMEALTTGMPQ